MFPSLQHIASLQREGLQVYDASENTIIRSYPLVVFGTADSPASAVMSGTVGHSGRYGCWLVCDMPSRRCTGDGHYYPVMNLPDGYGVEGCLHPDVTCNDLSKYRTDLARKYRNNMEFLLASRTQTEYKYRRLATGLSKQTLFSGLPRLPLPIPSLFTMDIMHLSVLNDPDLLIKLFTGKLDVYDPDDRSSWDWAIFFRNPTLWNAHGETVTRAIPFLPSSFGHAPRDPAKKINSGYKAWEFQQYVYGLCPTLLRHLLPQKYWKNFCKLVAGIRILQRPRVPYQDLLQGHNLLMDFVCEFEELYYQHKESRIHFVRQSIHLLTHIAPETFRLGPLACYAQWTLETAIGNLGREIRQDRDMFANLTQRAVLHAQINSLQARFPEIRFEVGEDTVTSLLNGAREFEGYIGYAFLPQCEEFPSPLEDNEHEALKVYWHAQNWPNADTWPHAVCCWGKLQLPNGQKARSVWQEANVLTKPRRSSCVEVNYNEDLRIANVLYYFYIRFRDDRYPLAMVSLFSKPDPEILLESSGAVHLCDQITGCGGVAVIPITAVHSVVAMIPEIPYHIDRRGERNVPKQYLKGAFWQTEQGDPGYVVLYTYKDGKTGLIPVEFNFDHTCWTEIRWDELHGKLQVVRPAGSGLHLDIRQSETTTRDQWGPIDGQEEEPIRSPTPKTPAPSPSLGSNPEEIRILEVQAEEEEAQLGILAESIPTDMTTTITEQPTTFQEPARISRGGGPPSGGHGGGGGDDGGGDPGEPLFTGPNVSSGTKPEKFMGKEPLVFTGDRTKVQQFLTQWELFVETNYDNPAFTLPYRKALIFLTYIQGDHVNEWVLSTTKWVKAYKAKHGPYDKWIWEAIELGFRNTFADTLEKERAQQELQKGFRMEGQDIDSVTCRSRTARTGCEL
ncbi:hypothetical protein EDB87DRAFT_1696226 [Lactarius vividus]|nr:hypothetical protein EDB87DRAFT_1696226 [Lactarius vividus]